MNSDAILTDVQTSRSRHSCLWDLLDKATPNSLNEYLASRSAAHCVCASAGRRERKEKMFLGRLFVASIVRGCLDHQISATAAPHPLGSTSLRSRIPLRHYQGVFCIWFLMHAAERHPSSGHVSSCLKALRKLTGSMQPGTS